MEVDDCDSDESSSLSSLSGESQDGKSANGSDDEDDRDEDEDGFDVAQMTDREARKMFNDEVFFFSYSICLSSEILRPSYPRLQISMQLRYLTTTTTSKSPRVFPIAVGKGPVRKLRAPPHQNRKGYSTMQVIQVKRRWMRTTPSLCVFPRPLEVPSGRSLAK